MENTLEITMTGGEYRVDSRLVAQSLGIEHRSFMRSVQSYQSELSELGAVRFEIAPRKGENKGGDQPKYTLLNEDQAIFLATLSRNTREAR